MTRKMIDVTVSAVVCIISRVKQKHLIPVENLSTVVSVPEFTKEDNVVLGIAVDCALRYKWVELFQERLKNTPALKHKIGGIKWSADILSFSYEVAVI